MKFSLFKLIKFYFGLLIALIVLGLALVAFIVVQKHRSEKELAQHPYVQTRLAEGYEIVKDCGRYEHRWNSSTTALCLEKHSADSSAIKLTRVREVFVHETDAKACAYRVMRPSDSTCVPDP